MLEINFHPFKNLETERLLLRRLDRNDVLEILELRGNPETMKYIPRPLTKTTDDALEHIDTIESKIINNEGINWAITLKDNPKLIGLIGLYRIKPEHHRAEIGYMILPEFNGRGIVTESIKLVLDYAFYDLKLHSVEAIIDPANLGSEKVLLKTGFVKEGHFIENEYYEGKFLDAAVYSLLDRNHK